MAAMSLLKTALIVSALSPPDDTPTPTPTHPSKPWATGWVFFGGFSMPLIAPLMALYYFGYGQRGLPGKGAAALCGGLLGALCFVWFMRSMLS